MTDSSQQTLEGASPANADANQAPHSEFLLGLSKALQNTSPDLTFKQTAERVIGVLLDATNAESIAVVPEDSSSLEFVAVGSPLGDRPDWQRVVEARQDPVSGAAMHRSFCGVAYSAIRDFLLVPITQHERLLGWLVADVDEEGDKEIAFQSSVMMPTAAILATQAINEERITQKELLLLDVVRSLVSAIDAKDTFTCGHSIRVAAYASLVAKGLGFSSREREEVYLSGLLHDVGKIGMPNEVFKMDSSLTPEEFELVKQHPDHGWKILYRLEDLQYILPGVVHHHERFDGSGYPDGISGEDIPIVARILAAVDAYDALTSARPYRKGKSHCEALSILGRGAGTQWDPAIVEAIHLMSAKLERVSRKYRNKSDLWRLQGTIQSGTQHDRRDA